MTQQPLFINWLTGQPVAKDIVSVMDPAFGAHGDGVTDDSTAIQSAINALPKGGMVYLPPAPGGFYAIGAATAITLPSTCAICLMGAGRGSVNGTPGTLLKATASLSSMLKTSTSTFSRGHRVSNMTWDGNNQTTIVLQMDLIGSSTFDVLDILNATTTNFRLGTASLNSLENVLFALRLDNPLMSHTPASLPAYSFENNSTNNMIYGVKCINSKTANFHSASTAINNYYAGLHGYSFDYTSQIATAASTNNFLIDGNSEQFVGWECDGASTANIQINNFNNMFFCGVSQFAAGLTEQLGIQIASGKGGNVIIGNQFLNPTISKSIVQSGSAFATGNIILANYNQSNGGVIPGAWLNSPVVLTGTSGSQAFNVDSLIINASGTFTLTLLSASAFPGMQVYVRSVANQTVNSASSNIVPLAGGAAGTALLSNTAGKWAILRSDASNWQIMAAN